MLTENVRKQLTEKVTNQTIVTNPVECSNDRPVRMFGLHAVQIVRELLVLLHSIQ